jgi:hypothetical protein
MGYNMHALCMLHHAPLQYQVHLFLFCGDWREINTPCSVSLTLGSIFDMADIHTQPQKKKMNEYKV